jgi:hypothetical protein
MEQKQHQEGFMLRIWSITLLSMCITGGLTYGYHLFMTSKEARRNAAEIDTITFRMEKYEGYKKNIETFGKENALDMIIEE